MKSAEMNSMVWEIGNNEVEEFLTMAYNCRINLLKLEAKEGEDVNYDGWIHTLGKNQIAIRVEIPKDIDQYMMFGIGWLASHGWEYEGWNLEIKPTTPSSTGLM